MVLEAADEFELFQKNRHALALKSGRTKSGWFGSPFY